MEQYLNSIKGLKSLKDLSQLIFTSTPFGSGIAFVDNIYFSGATTGIKEDESNLDVYPNPVYNGGTIQFNGAVKSVEIFDITGQKVFETQDQTIALNGFSTGMYTIKSVDQFGTLSVHKLIVR
jgi:hypothetical protein